MPRINTDVVALEDAAELLRAHITRASPSRRAYAHRILKGAIRGR
jgi:hypothetical protein